MQYKEQQCYLGRGDLIKQYFVTKLSQVHGDVVLFLCRVDHWLSVGSSQNYVVKETESLYVCLAFQNPVVSLCHENVSKINITYQHNKLTSYLLALMS